MTTKPPAQIRFPTARDKGPFPFPTAQSMAAPTSDIAPPDLPSAEELRLMADTMPGDGPGDQCGGCVPASLLAAGITVSKILTFHFGRLIPAGRKVRLQP